MEKLSNEKIKKIACWNFTISRISNSADLLKVFHFLEEQTEILSIGLENKATIGSDHLQGFFIKKPDVKFYQIKNKLQDFLKKNFSSSPVYFIKVPDATDAERCIKYTVKEGTYVQKVPFYDKVSSEKTYKFVYKNIKNIL